MATKADLESLTGERGELVDKLVAALAERNAELAARDAALAAREAKLDAAAVQIAKQAAQYEALREAYMQLQLELKLLKRKIFIASAERADTTQLQLEFETLTQKLDALAGVMGNPSESDGDPSDESGDSNDPEAKKKRRSKSTGRRRVEEMGLRKETVSLTDPHMEKLVEAGLARRLPEPEVSHKLGRKPAEYIHVEILRTTYATSPDENGRTEMFTADMPPELLPRCLAAPSMLAEVITDKFSKGLPLYRQEQELLFESVSIDRGTMCRWLDQLGSRFNETIVAAMERDAMESAFCIATDATGFAVQPGKLDDGPRRPCRKGHYFVRIADRDHILFNFTERQRSEDVVTLFKGYGGHIQADACSVYNALFRPADPDAPDDELPTEVGCWSHARRKFFEAAFAKLAIGREGLVYLHKIFEVERRCRAGKPPPSTVKARRLQHLAPLIDEFVDFAKQHYEREKKRRGPARAALGYVVRQEGPLRAVLADGRLRIDNNWSERELRKVVRIRDAALFAGSTKHAENAGAHLTLIASAKLHHLNPREYIRDLIRVLPCWPEDRYLELAPLFWNQTRARLDPAELAAEVGWITVPDPIPLRRPGEESPAEDRA
ncbi:MAG: IS66 family transposase [Sandaracinaceae bacterium]|nr:IS66 family transposase [Myxococcales bacterium]MCB9658387.1 IS66 family transposase [Sandaracinaceae bacterium]MCB9661876.1 IS66 family transposase [Sandaracinaceae bacterium]